MLDILFGGLCKVSPPMVSGQVRLADGSPVAGAQVVLLDVADLGRGPMGQATTDEAGQFALPLAASGAFGLPQGFALGPNYPNPFGSVLNNNKSLAYLAKRGEVSIYTYAHFTDIIETDCRAVERRGVLLE